MEESTRSVGRFEYGKEHVSLVVPPYAEGQHVLPEFFVVSGPSHFAYDDPTWVSPNVQQEVMVVEAGHPFLWYRRLQQQQRLGVMLSRILGVLGLVISLAVVFSWFPIVTAQATVTIFPDQETVTLTPTLFLKVSPSPTLNGQELRMRHVPTLTLSQSVMVRATGMHQQPGAIARGLVTFLNESWSERIIPAGTRLTTKNSTMFITDQEAIIPGATPSLDGWSTVSAHSEKSGSEGNIAPSQLTGTCCTSSVSYTNFWPFTGGLTTRTYSTVTQSDLDRSLTPLRHSLEASTRAALQAQGNQNETLLTPTPCTHMKTLSRPVGSAVSSLTVTLSETCPDVEAINTLDLQAVVTSSFTQQAQLRLGSRYRRLSDVGVTVLACRVLPHDPEGLSLFVRGTAMWQYSLTDEEVQTMINSVAGQNKGVALHRLRRHPGVLQIHVQISGLEKDTFPLDPSRIRVMMMSSGN